MDGGDMLRDAPQPIDWFLQDVLPLGTTGDVFSPPNAGKTSLLISLVLAVAGGRGNWFGHKCVSGPVLILGGEKSSRAVWVRDLHRATGGEKYDIERGRIVIAPSELGPILEWDQHEKQWVNGIGMGAALKMANALHPVLIIIDTIGRGCAGQDPINIPQQQALADRLEQFGRRLGGTLLTVSHTSQSSRSEDLYQRLEYTARAGSSGLPGHFRWLLGMTRLKPEEAADRLGINKKDEEAMEDLAYRNIVAAAVSKPSEMPHPPRGWSLRNPALFEILPNGQMVRLDDEEAPTKRELKAIARGAQEYAKASQAMEPADENQGWTNDAPF
ncbi:AAA family ATPase [Acidiferrobacter sp.]|jgi:RecA-family ATPase